MKNVLKTIVIAAFIAVTTMTVTVLADNQVTGVVTADALNIRALPNTSSAVIGLVRNGQEVTITEAKDNWFKITYANFDAYVCADYVTANAVPNYVDVFSKSAPAVTQISSPYSNIPSYAGSEVKGEMLVEYAKAYIGTPYVYGGMSPSGFDCSGFVKFCYSIMGVDINRVSYDQAKNGYEVPRDDMKPGDILCFASSIGGSYIGHTGIYVGNGYFIHSPREGLNVEIIPLTYGSYSQRIANVRRIFD